MQLKRIMGICLLTACVMLCVACGQQNSSAASSAASSSAGSQASSSAASKTTSEGVDTPIQVNYAPYAGTHGSMFLAEGDSIAVIAPSALPSQEQVDAVVKGLKELGYTPVLGKHVTQENRTLADCAEDLVWALEDPTVKAIFCVRGGYGVSEVMDIVPLELIASAGKLIIGYSDISTCHAAWTSAGLPSIHACMSVAFTDLPKACVQAEQRILRGEVPAYTCEADALCKKGEAEGILIGGNLSTFMSVLNTAYDATKTDKPFILFFEDVEEDVQHVHRYLTILKHLGVLDRASGIVFGEWTDLPPFDEGDYDGGSRGGEFKSIADMISRQIVRDLDIPVAYGFPAGHGDNNYPLLMGEKAHLSVGEGSFTLTWE